MSRSENKNFRRITYPMPREPDRDIGRRSDTYSEFEPEMLNTRLIESIPGGDIAYMRRLMTMGANPNATCCLNHVSACHIAAMHDNEALDLLLSSGADRYRSDKQGRTPLLLAAWAGNVKHIASLLDFPEDLRKRVEDYVLIISSTVDEVEKHCAPVNEFINKHCHPSEVITLADGWRDGVDHTHRNVMELLPPFRPGWTALHAASARAQNHCVQLLLAAGADAGAQDLLWRTPLDVAGCAHYNRHKIDINNFVKTVDLLLKAGGKFLKYLGETDQQDTPLHTAVELEIKSEAVVEQMLQGGASATVWNSQGLTAMHVCVKKRNKELLQLLANHMRCNAFQQLATVDTKDVTGCTVLCAAVEAEWIEGVRIALSAGATNMKASEKSPKDYIATQLKNKEILQEDNPLTNECISHNQLRPGETTVLHLAVIKNHYEIAKTIIKHDSRTVHVVVDGRSPLHEACSRGNKKIIELLLRNGADLSGGENVNESYYFGNQRKFVPIELLMNNVSKPTEFLQEIFDSYITSKGQESKCEVEVDYRVLFPKSDMIPMGVIKAMNATGNRCGQDRLLLHPLVQSFLYLKWRSLSSFFYGTLALHVCFVFSLNVFALSLFGSIDRKIEDLLNTFGCNVWIYIIYLTACLLTIQEIIVINMKSKRYLLCLESLVKWLSTTLAVTLPQVVSRDSKPIPEWVRLFSSATLLLSWVRMMFLLSRLPGYGYYFLMFGKVATKVFKILLSFGFLIFGFSICFLIQFHAQEPFEGPWSSFLTTMVMMTSEFNYNEIINKKTAERASASLIMMRLVFVSFLILVSIILMNLLVGVAVNDVNSLEIIGNINRLEKQMHFITSFEDIGCNNYIKKILPTILYKQWIKNAKWNNIIALRPHEATRSNGYILPAHLKEAIFEKAQLQKRQSDEEQSTMLCQTKLDEIHKVIVKKNGGEPSKSHGPDNALNKIMEDINKLIEDNHKIRSDIEIIKNSIDTTKRHSFTSNFN